MTGGDGLVVARARRVLRCVSLGVVVALENTGLSVVIAKILELRTNFAIKEYEDDGHFTRALLRLVLLDAVFAGAAAWGVAFVAPSDVMKLWL